MTIHKLPAVPPDIIVQIRTVEPEAVLPRGFFDTLVEATRMLLDRGLSLPQAADWLIDNKVIERRHRRKYHDAMRGRLSRLNRKTATSGELAWKEAMGFNSVHAVGGGLTSLCGVSASRWFSATSTSSKCSRCRGLVAIKGLSLED